MLLALGGEVVARGPSGTRTIPADELFVTYFTTALAPDEVLTHVRIPRRAHGQRFGFEEVARKQSDFALAGAAVAVEIDGEGICGSARIAVFGVDDRPVRSTAAEQALAGRKLDRRRGRRGGGDRAGRARAQVGLARVGRVPQGRGRRGRAARASPGSERRRCQVIAAPRLVEGEAVVRLVVNGEERRAIAEPRMLLCDFLRHELGLTGTHVGCEQGVCGACTVRMDGEIVRSCLLFAVQAEGRAIETVEGLAPGR